MISRNPLRRENFRFELRPCDFTCVYELFKAADESRGQISPWMAWLHPEYSLRDCELWVAHSINAWTAQSEYEFVIYDRQDGLPAGSCGLNNINRKDMVANLGYWVRTSKSRQGAATQAALMLKDFGLSVVGFNRLEIMVADGNEASRGVAQKVGALYEGIQRRRVKVGDKVFDGHMYALV
jgi:RimJ/RimL family protein N-acetyltransferase